MPLLTGVLIVYSTYRYLLSESNGNITGVKSNRYAEETGNTYCARPELVETSKLPTITFLGDVCQQLKMKGLSRTRGGDRTGRSEGAEGRPLVIERETHNTIVTLRNCLWDLPTQFFRRWPWVS